MSDILKMWDVPGSLEPVCYIGSEFIAGMKSYNSIVWESLKTASHFLGCEIQKISEGV